MCWLKQKIILGPSVTRGYIWITLPHSKNTSGFPAWLAREISRPSCDTLNRRDHREDPSADVVALRGSGSPGPVGGGGGGVVGGGEVVGCEGPKRKTFPGQKPDAGESDKPSGGACWKRVRKTFE